VHQTHVLLIIQLLYLGYPSLLTFTVHFIIISGMTSTEPVTDCKCYTTCRHIRNNLCTITSEEWSICY